MTFPSFSNCILLFYASWQGIRILVLFSRGKKCALQHRLYKDSVSLSGYCTVSTGKLRYSSNWNRKRPDNIFQIENSSNCRFSTQICFQGYIPTSGLLTTMCPYSLVLNTSHGTPIQDSLNFPPNSFIPTWSLSKKCAMSTIAPWS